MSRRKVAFVGAALMAGCTVETTGPIEDPRPFTVRELEVSAANTAFGLGLFQELHAAVEKPNLLVSPLSVSMALGMTMNGAEGETYDAMRAALGFGALPEDEVNAAYAGLIAQLRARDRKVEFRLANSVWYRGGFPIEQPFLDAVRETFDADVRDLDFSAPSAPATISGWAEDATGGRIKDLIRQIDPLEVLFLVNAVYFKAPWTQPFNEHGTHDAPFHLEGGSTVTAPRMSQDARYLHFQNDDVVGVELLYADSAFSMVVLMPADGRTLDDLVEELTPSQWQQWLDAMQPGRIQLMVPKFRFTWGDRLNDALRELGMGVAFDPSLADFDRITRARDDLYISRVEHKSFIDVHELGTEAAAATAVGVSVTSAPPSIEFDRPFVFAIRERGSGTLLFMGRVGDPTATE